MLLIDTIKPIECFAFVCKVSEKIPLTKLDEKYNIVVKYCDKEVDRILKLFKRQRDDPPLPRHMPAIAGRLTWANSLKYVRKITNYLYNIQIFYIVVLKFICRVHLDELATSVSNHPVLKTLPLTMELEKRYNYALSVLNQYKSDIAEVWTHQNSWVIEDSLKR